LKNIVTTFEESLPKLLGIGRLADLFFRVIYILFLIAASCGFK
jgi:hypothetical protein